MMEFDIDMEELEARLYGQVYHSSNTDDMDAFKIPNIQQNDSTDKSFPRYFDNGDQLTKKRINRNTSRKYIATNETGVEFDHNRINITNHYTFEKSGLFQLPQVNNIVLIQPQPAPTIVPQKNQALNSAYNANERKKRRNFKKKLKRLAKLKQANRDNTENSFNFHYLNRQINNFKENEQQPIIVNEPDVVCLSDSDNSDCEVVDRDLIVVEISSDEEDKKDVKINSDVPKELIKWVPKELFECVSKESDEQSFHKITKESVISKHEILAESTSNANVESKGHLSKTKLKSTKEENEENDVIFIEPQQPVTSIIIDNDESQSCDCRTDSLENNTRKQSELLEATECVASNDFLDSNLHFETNLSSNNSPSKNKTYLDNYESDSSCSTNTCEKVRNFIVEPCDVPSTNIISDFTLDGFTDYITSNTGLTSKTAFNIKKSVDKRKKIESGNTSDSSSESDYELSKSEYVDRQKKTKQSATTSNKDIPKLFSFNFNVDGTAECSSNQTLEENANNNSLSENSEKTIEIDVENISSHSTDAIMETATVKQDDNCIPSTSYEKRESEDINTSFHKRMKQVENYITIEKDIEDEENWIDVTKDSSPSNQSVIEIEDESSNNIQLLNTIQQDNSYPEQEDFSSKLNRFSNYWTEDMEKFYRESWGHENFSVANELQKMSDDPNKWKIHENDHINLNILPKGKRCHKCREFGHKYKDCERKTKTETCILCGRWGHTEYRCPRKMCTSCTKPASSYTTYCNKCTYSAKRQCNICQSRTHITFLCPDLWRRYHTTTNNGPIQSVDKQRTKRHQDQWCSGCGWNGHYEYQCGYYNRTHAPVNPHVLSYKEVYKTNLISKEQSNKIETTTSTIRHDSWAVDVEPSSSSFVIYNETNSNKEYQPPEKQARVDAQDTSPNTSAFFSNNEEINISRNQNVGNVDFLKLTQADAYKLLQPIGAQFLNALGHQEHVSIQLYKRGTTEYRYVCVLCHSQSKTKIRGVIKDFCKNSILKFDISDKFDRELFLWEFKNNVSQLCDRNMNWRGFGKNVLKKITFLKTVLRTISKKKMYKTIKLQEELRCTYAKLNSVLLGKLHYLQGFKHFKILTDFNNNNSKQIKPIVFDSYNYVFKRDSEIPNIDYKEAISKL